VRKPRAVRPAGPAGRRSRLWNAAITVQYAGTWTIARSILECERSTEIICTGSAELCPRDDGVIVYDEAVSFRLAGKLIHATRAYRFTSSNGAIVATFNDGTPFFNTRLTADGIGTAIHYCRDDIYALTLTLREVTAWQTQWDISGTRRLRIITHYTR
jgi:hypothetical protein